MAAAIALTSAFDIHFIVRICSFMGLHHHLMDYGIMADFRRAGGVSVGVALVLRHCFAFSKVPLIDRTVVQT